jgi:hypothetical protein
MNENKMTKKTKKIPVPVTTITPARPMSVLSAEQIHDVTDVRGRMVLRLDAQGQVTRDEVTPAIKHVFSAQLYREGFKVLIDDYLLLPNWDLQWDQYIGDPVQLEALYKLTNGGLPSELYQIEVMLGQMRTKIPKNGGYIDGPFALTTHADINTQGLLVACLEKLSQSELNLVLHSSYLRHLKL